MLTNKFNEVKFLKECLRLHELLDMSMQALVLFCQFSVKSRIRLFDVVSEEQVRLCGLVCGLLARCFHHLAHEVGVGELTGVVIVGCFRKVEGPLAFFE